LPWFRWLKKQQIEAADDAAAEDAAPVEPVVPTPGHETSPDIDETEVPPADTASQRRRRRGSRGGRGRRKPAAADSGGEAAVAVTEPPTREAVADGKPDRGGARRSRQGGERRRRQQQRRAPLPAAERELLISVDVGEQRVAVIEDGKVAEVYLERPERRSITGNIYLGTVDNVLPGMEAAFVEIGLEKNGFQYLDEIVVPELEGRRQGRKITDLIQRGQQILVQAVKDPMKTKGARLTTEISLPGRFLVYVPYGEGLGVSRRLDDAERQRLKEILRGLDPKQGGVIVRTAAEGASAEDIERDLVFLQRLWKTIQARANAAKAPELVYQEAELPLRIVRDLFAGDFRAAHVDDDRAYRRIVGYLKKTSPHMLERVHRDKEKDRLFARYGVDKEIASTLERRVDLPSGGYLIFDYAEAFTVIDVNTGRFVGSRSKTSTQRLEDTIVKNNLEAVKEVVRQLRLRDIGGIIVIDFIDMANPKNRQSVEEALRNELERDRTKTYVVEISPLGLVEMTRQNVTDGPREVMTRKCPTCAGDGIVVSDATAALDVERRLRELAGSGSRVQAYRVAVHPRVLPLLAGPGGERLTGLEERTKRRFFLVAAEGHAHTDHLEVLEEGKLADLQPTAALEEGAELEVKLGEVALHDPSAAVAKVDGVDVVVEGAGRLVGKKAKVTVGRVLGETAFATLVTTDGRPAPITFESEAEKPTRAPARRRPAVAEAAEDVSAAVSTEEPEVEAVVAADDFDGDGDESDGGETPKKKRTRRGSRGGRKRRKPATAEGAAATVEPADGESADDMPAAPDGVSAPDTSIAEPVVPADEASGDGPAPTATARKRTRAPRAPKIHLPAADVPGVAETEEPATERAASTGEETAGDGVDGGPAPKKRTRRGSRGGHSRRKKPAAATVDGADGGSPAPVADEAPAPATTAVADGGGYVPMSEWLDDFDR
jgi:ribonuclease G